MPLYEMVMVARVGEQAALTNSIKGISQTILSAGGVVRSMDNLGDRVLVKNLRHSSDQMMALSIVLEGF